MNDDWPTFCWRCGIPIGTLYPWEPICADCWADEVAALREARRAVRPVAAGGVVGETEPADPKAES